MLFLGSLLYKQARDSNLELPDTYEGFSFHAYETVPFPTEKLTPGQVLKFRDDNFIKKKDKKFLKLIKEKFGKEASENIVEMAKVKLKRKLIERENLENK